MIVWLGCLSYLLIGLAHVVLGSVLEELIGYYNLDYSQGSQLIFNQFAGFLFGVLVTPWLLRRFGRKRTLFIALTALTVAEAIYSFLPPWGWMLAIGPIAGFGFGMIEAAIGALIIEFVTENKATAMSRLEVAFGVGALLMPALAGLLIRYGDWEWSFPFVASVSFITLLAWWRMPLGAAHNLMNDSSTNGTHRAPVPGYTRRTFVILLLMIFFFLIYVGAEMSFVHFVPSILIENIGVQPSVATTGITAFWATMIVGRLFAGVLAERFGYVKYLIVSCIGMIAFLILFAFSSQLWVSLAAILLIGLFMAGMFAIALLFVNARIPGMTERTTSLTVAAGGVGGALVPRMMGWTMDTFSLSVTYGILIGSAVLLLVLVVAAAWPSKQEAI